MKCYFFQEPVLSLLTTLKKRLAVPTNTRWNSLYDSLLVLNKVLEELKDQMHRCNFNMI